MLVLSRKRNESICLPDLDLKITVLEIVGGKVRLGISAPDNVDIIRDELTWPDRRAAAGVCDHE
jgi:carbon storage regulator